MCEIRMTRQKSRQAREVKKAATETGFVTPLKVLTVKKFCLICLCIFIFFARHIFVLFFRLDFTFDIELVSESSQKKTHTALKIRHKTLHTFKLPRRIAS